MARPRLPGLGTGVEGSDSRFTDARVWTHAYTEFTPYNTRLLLVFLALSLLAHLLLMMWPNPLIVPPLIAEHKYPPLQVQLQATPTPPATPQIKQRHKPKTRTQVTRTSPPAKFGTQTHNKPKSAEEVIEEAYKAVPAIVKELDSKHGTSESAVIFDPRLRKQLQQARRKQARYEALLRAIAKRPEIEVLAKTADYLKLRIHGHCWRVPISRGYDPFDVRVMVIDTNCPKPKSKLFDKQSDPIPLP